MDLLLAIQRTSKDWGEDFFFQTPGLLSTEASSQMPPKIKYMRPLLRLGGNNNCFLIFAACDEESSGYIDTLRHTNMFESGCPYYHAEIEPIHEQSSRIMQMIEVTETLHGDSADRVVCHCCFLARAVL